jgi:hypothetical protein
LDFSLQVPNRFGQVFNFSRFVFISSPRDILYCVAAIKVHALGNSDDLNWINILIVAWVDGVISPIIRGGHGFLFWCFTQMREVRPSALIFFLPYYGAIPEYLLASFTLSIINL